MLALSGGGAGAAERSAEQAYRASTAAMMAHDFAGAIPNLKYAAEHGVFLAQYYLARVYAIEGQPYTDRLQAFHLLEALVDANPNIDPYIDKRAPFIARAETMLALYYRTGVPGLVASDPTMARAHLERAALRLGDTEAQFQLAVMDLQTDEFQPRAMDTLDMLAQSKHHAGAAAQIALVYSKDRQGGKIPFEALGYAGFAVSLAGEADRVWIGDVYQSLYCQASPAVRAKGAAFATELERSAFDTTDGDRQPPEVGDGHQRVQGILDLGDVGTERVCGNGETVPDVAGAKITPAPVGADGLNGKPEVIAKGFNSAVGFIAPPMGLGLKDLETPSTGDEHGEPLGGVDDQPTQ